MIKRRGRSRHAPNPTAPISPGDCAITTNINDLSHKKTFESRRFCPLCGEPINNHKLTDRDSVHVECSIAIMGDCENETGTLVYRDKCWKPYPYCQSSSFDLETLKRIEEDSLIMECKNDGGE